LRSVTKGSTQLSLRVPNDKLGRILVALGRAWDGQPMESNSPLDGGSRGCRRRRKSAQRDKRVARDTPVRVPASIPPRSRRREGGAAPTTTTLIKVNPGVGVEVSLPQPGPAPTGGCGSIAVKAQQRSRAPKVAPAPRPPVMDAKNRGTSAAAEGVVEGSRLEKVGVVQKGGEATLSCSQNGVRPPSNRATGLEAAPKAALQGGSKSNVGTRVQPSSGIGVVLPAPQQGLSNSLSSLPRSVLLERIEALKQESRVCGYTSGGYICWQRVTLRARTPPPAVDFERIKHKCGKKCSYWCTEPDTFLYDRRVERTIEGLKQLETELARRDTHNRQNTAK